MLSARGQMCYYLTRFEIKGAFAIWAPRLYNSPPRDLKLNNSGPSFLSSSINFVHSLNVFSPRLCFLFLLLQYVLLCSSLHSAVNSAFRLSATQTWFIAVFIYYFCILSSPCSALFVSICFCCCGCCAFS